GVDRHATSEFVAERPCQPFERELRRRIVGPAKLRHYGGSRGNVDDPPLPAPHAATEIVHHVKGPVQIDVDAEPPTPSGVFERGEGRGNSRVVDEQVATPELGENALGERG